MFWLFVKTRHAAAYLVMTIGLGIIAVLLDGVLDVRAPEKYAVRDQTADLQILMLILHH